MLTAQLDEGEEELAGLEKRLGEAQARLQPIMAPSLKCIQDGSTSLFGDDLDDNKAVLTEFLEEIVIFADGEIMIGFREESILGPVLGWAGDLGETIGKDGIYLLKTPSPEEFQRMVQAEYEEAEKEWGPQDPAIGPSLRRGIEAENDLPPDSEESGGKSSSDPTGTFQQSWTEPVPAYLCNYRELLLRKRKVS